MQMSSGQEKSFSLANLQQLSLAAEDLQTVNPVKIPACTGKAFMSLHPSAVIEN